MAKKKKKLSKARIEKAVAKTVAARKKKAAKIPKGLKRVKCQDCDEPAVLFDKFLTDNHYKKIGDKTFRATKQKCKGWCHHHAPAKAYV